MLAEVCLKPCVLICFSFYNKDMENTLVLLLLTGFCYLYLKLFYDFLCKNHTSHCVASLNKTIYNYLVLVQPRKHPHDD